MRKYSNTTNFSYSYLIEISITKTWQNGHSTCYQDVLTEKTFHFIPRKQIHLIVFILQPSLAHSHLQLYLPLQKLIARVVPRKGSACRRNIPPHSVQLQTAGPTARDYAHCCRSICHGSLLSLEQQPSPPVLQDMIQTHKQVVAAPLHFFIQNIS